MNILESDQLPNWLGLTNQQVEILTTIISLEDTDTLTTPKEIRIAYKKKYNKYIQAPNLFTILRHLRTRRILLKRAQSTYFVDFDGINEILLNRKRELDTDLLEFDELLSKTEDYLRLKSREEVPVVEFIDKRHFYDRVAKSLRKSKYYFGMGRFPGIAYTPTIYTTLGRQHYGDVYWIRCISEKKLNITYLSNMDISHPYNYALEIFGDPNRAYKECLSVINQLENICENHNHVKIIHTVNLPGSDVLIPEIDKTNDFYLILRDGNLNSIAYIYIKSANIAPKVKSMFMKLCELGDPITAENSSKYMDNLRHELKRLHHESTAKKKRK